jgi:hypothetical protein
VLEVATICVHTGLNPARHILESPCQYVRCHCLNFFGDVGFQGVYGSWFVLVNSPFQISPSEIIRRRQIGRARARRFLPSLEEGSHVDFDMSCFLKI